MKKLIIGIIVGVVGLTSLSACATGESEPEYAAICVDPNTEERLPDDYCDDDDSSYLAYAVLWYMAMNSSHSYPAVGSKVTKSHYLTKLPKKAKYTTGLSTKGGTSVKSWSSTKYGGSTTKKNTGTTSTNKSGGSTSRSTTTRRR